MFLLKEIPDNFHQPVPGFLAGCRARGSSASRRQHTHVIHSQQYHYNSQNEHNRHPSLHSGIMTNSLLRSRNSPIVFQQPPCQPNQPTGCDNLSNIIESTLPTDIFGLILRRELFHINAIRCHVMRSPAKRYNT